MKWKLNEDMRTGLLVGAVLVLFGFAYLLVGQDEVVGQAFKGVGESCNGNKLFLSDSDGDGVFESVGKCVKGKKVDCPGKKCPREVTDSAVLTWQPPAELRADCARLEGLFVRY